MDRIQVEGLCSLGKIGLAHRSSILSFDSHLKVLLRGIRQDFAQKLRELGGMLCLFISCLLPVQADLRIALAECHAAHRKVHADLGALSGKVGAKIFLDIFRNIRCDADYVLSCPCHLIFLLRELGCRSLTYRTCFRSCISLIHITAYITYPLCHNIYLLFLLWIPAAPPAVSDSRSSCCH